MARKDTKKEIIKARKTRLLPKLHISYRIYKFFQIGKTGVFPYKVNKFAHDDFKLNEIVLILFDDKSRDCGRDEQNSKNNR